MPLKNLPYLFALLSVIAAAQSYRTQDWTWQERAVLAVFVALTAALPPLLSGRSGRRWWVRSCLVSAHRLMAFTVPMEASAALSQLQLQPTTGGLGAVVDAIHLLIGSRGLRLLLFGIGLPLDLPSHLVVHTLCLAISLASLPQACTQQLLDSPLTGGRIAAFHRLMAVGMGGLLPLGYPPGGKHIECSSALVFMCGFLGWVLPTYAVLRRHGREARKQAAKTAAEAAEVLAAAAAEAARRREREPPALAALAGCDTASADPRGAAAAGVLSAGGAQGSRQSAALLTHPRMDAAASWVLSNMFLTGAPLEHRVTSWCILAVLCWLASTVVAVRVIA